MIGSHDVDEGDLDYRDREFLPAQHHDCGVKIETDQREEQGHDHVRHRRVENAAELADRLDE